jgi:hypothetical protein
MNERPGAARGGLTIAQAQELILAQAEAVRQAALQGPSVAQSFIPIVGPAWQAIADAHDGDYPAAGFNALMAVADALPAGVALKGLSAARKGVGVWKKGSLTAEAARKAYRRRGMAKPVEEEVHHTVPLDGIPRNVQNWRNHYAFLKALPKEQHRRLTGSFGVNTKYDPVHRVWYGTADWMKAVPTGAAGYTADSIENLMRPPPVATQRR